MAISDLYVLIHAFCGVYVYFFYRLFHLPLGIAIAYRRLIKNAMSGILIFYVSLSPNTIQQKKRAYFEFPLIAHHLHRIHYTPKILVPI